MYDKIRDQTLAEANKLEKFRVLDWLERIFKHLAYILIMLAFILVIQSFIAYKVHSAPLPGPYEAEGWCNE